MRGSSSDAALVGKVAETGVGMGEEMRIPRMPFRLGDLREEINEEVRECDFVFPSSRVRVAGRAFSTFFGGESVRGGPIGTGPIFCSCGGRGISFKITPLAFASSCSITWAYMSSKSRCNISRSASTILVSTYGSARPFGVVGDLLMLGKTYGFLVSFSGEGHEKFLGPPPGAPGETGEGSKAAVFGKVDSTISISSALVEF